MLLLVLQSNFEGLLLKTFFCCLFFNNYSRLTGKAHVPRVFCWDSIGFSFFGVLLQSYYGTVTATTLYAFCGKDVDYIVVVIDVAKYSNAPAIAAVDARSAFCSNVLSTR